MRGFTKIMASSVYFDPTTQAISSSAGPGMGSTGSFAIAAGAIGGPLSVQFGTGIALQGNFGGKGNASSGAYGGVFNLLGSNTLETPMFQIVATTTVSSTGGWIIRDSAPWYRFVNFQFIPSISTTSGILTAIFHEKGTY